MIKKIFLILIYSLILLFEAFSKTKKDISDERAVMLINYLHYSLAQIKANPDKIVAEHEFETIVNNINSTSLKDEDIISAYNEMLGTLGSLKLLDEEKRHAEELAAKERKNAIFKILKSSGSIFAPGRHPLISLAYAGISAGLNYADARAQADINKFESEFQIEQGILRTIDEERRQLYTSSANVFSSRGDNDKIITEKLMEDFVKAIKQDSRTKESRLDSMKHSFELFPPFWFALGYAQQENGRYNEALKSYSNYERLMENEDILNFDETYCQLQFAKIEMQKDTSGIDVHNCIQKLEDEIGRAPIEYKSQVYYGIALVYYGLDDYQTARNYANKVRELAVGNWNETIQELEKRMKNNSNSVANAPSFKKIKGFGKNGLTEFINVETTFIFAHEDSSAGKIRKVYGSMRTSTASQDYMIPLYKTGESVYLDIEFKPYLLKEEEKKVKRIAKPEDISIPIAVTISGNCNVKYITSSDGVSNLSEEKTMESSIFRYSINTVSEMKYVRFLLDSKNATNADTARIVVQYGTSDYKIVDTACNVFETVNFRAE